VLVRPHDTVLGTHSHRSHQLEGFAQVAVDRAGTDPKAAGQIGVGLAFAQVGHHQQGLLSGVQATPSGAQLGAMCA
jgi:hypothetical protein